MSNTYFQSTININAIREIDFENDEIKKSFDEIEQENDLIVDSTRVSYESLKVRFEI